jgi:2-haloacid dehalogenase
MIRAVVFDIGNVLIEWNPERFFDALLGPAARREMFASVDLHAMNEAIDMGAPFRETIYAEADRHPRWRAAIRRWHDDWIEMASPAIPHSVRLLRALRRAGVPVFALTNFGVDSFAYARTQYDFLNEFDRFWVSGQIGVMKPDPQIYAHAEADCGLPPASLLFTDDRPENIAAASARGWHTHHFTGPGPWAARLVAERLLDERDAQ